MSEPFVGEIRMFAGNFAPRGWAFCDGQLLSISQNDALFSLLGTLYGGDGRTTFGLPDLRGRIPVHAGSGPGLTTRYLGANGGTENETLIVNQLPVHNHAPRAVDTPGTSSSPENAVWAAAPQGAFYVTGDANPGATMNSQIATQIGGSQSHTNMQPYLCIHFIIALVGIYPSRN